MKRALVIKLNLRRSVIFLFCITLTLIGIVLFISFLKYPEMDYIKLQSKSVVLDKQTMKTFAHYAQINELTTSKQSVSFQGKKFVHMDLKGAPPKISFYQYFFSLIKQLGADGVVIEYEDMFPYAGLLKNISALNAYTIDEIHYINKLAKKFNLEVIPLIQTFGHLEFVLKLEEFMGLREVKEFPQAICPSKKRTDDILQDLIYQMIDAHPNSKFIHIGADEVYHLGLCDDCIRHMHKSNISKFSLFMDHVEKVAEIILRKRQMSILMWDDELRSMSSKDLNKSFKNKFITPVVWRYTQNVYEDLGPSLWEMYSAVFPTVWVASAFKGATGGDQYLPDVTHYIQNHRSWLSVIEEYKNMFKFEGIIITGWQRYDHFATLCELLPVGIPSLAISLRSLQGFRESPLSPPIEVAKLLKCKQPYALMGPSFGTPKCLYPGGKILEKVMHLHQLKQEFETVIESPHVRVWMTAFNIHYNFSNPIYMLSDISRLSRIKKDLEQLDDEISEALREIYDKYTVNEWKFSYIDPLKTQILQRWEARKRILAKNTWPRRPVNII